MIKVSVIVPMLNSIRYIEECMNSIISQDLKDIEIICVDAGSTDGTVEYLNRIIEGNGRIKLVHASKKSYGYQMNIGIEQASGEYIGIVESDDIIPREMYSELYDVADKHELDFVKADFYRFTDIDGQRIKVLEKLSHQQFCYGKVISPKEYKEVFDFPLNTWSGIYKRSFLEENNIRHNESPGASFQDNGFWFQTFVFAERAYFVNKPYYLNRRDNPNSSVYSKGKVFAMSDEYDFILHILDENPQIKKEFWVQYVKAKLNGYYFTLRRISYEEKLEFLPRFAHDFRKMIEAKEFPVDSFSDLQLGALFRILYAEEDFEELYIKSRLQLYKKIRNSDGVIIFGAGKYGRKLYDDLCRDVPEANIIGFAVTDVNKNDESYKDIKVHDVVALEQYKHNLVIVALKHKREVLAMLLARGYDNVELLPPMVFPLA